MIVYDPRGHTWDSWCKLMAELFASNDLGYVPEEKWRVWADGVQGIGYFTQSGVPDQRSFKSWDDWAKALVGIMNLGR